MITIHEFGHYIAGKIFHFKINEFSIGFGPALFKRTNKKTGELFAVRLIPLGGYCAFEGENGETETPPPEPFSDDGEVTSDTAQITEAQRSLKGDKPKELKAFTQNPPWQRIIVLVAGALMNYLLALLLIIIGIGAYGQTMVMTYEIDATEEISAEYCLHDKDVLLKADGNDLYLTTDLAHALNKKKAGETVTFRVSRVVAVTDEGNVREETDVDILLREDVTVKNSSDLDSVWRALGVTYTQSEEYTGFQVYSTGYRFGFWEGLGRSFVYSFKIAGSIFRVLGELLTGKLGIGALGGPVTTITMTSQVVSQGARAFLEISGFIGVNLAVFNLLPIPALDGSKVVFTVIEWIRGKPVNRKVEAAIHAVGFLLLLGFAVLVDILQFVL